jgi:hypothetical protein
MRSQTEAMFTLRKGAIIAHSTKQKVNSRNLTKAKLNRIDNKISKVIWTKKFQEKQQYTIKINVIY